jgi:hypothetical protein
VGADLGFLAMGACLPSEQHDWAIELGIDHAYGFVPNHDIRSYLTVGLQKPC